MGRTCVALIDDDENLRLVVSTYLETDGYDVKEFSESQSFLNSVDAGGVDVILLDLMLAGENGLALLPQIKQKTNAPVIIVSGKTDTTDRVVGLELGADDYITKPFEMRELSARIKANLRRVQPIAPSNESTTTTDATQTAAVYNFGQWQLDGNRLQLLHTDGKQIEDLTKNEFDLLLTLVNSAGRTLSREYLYENLKEADYNSFDRAIDVQITRLRKKLGDDPSRPSYIKTIRGVGYMFIADVAA
ncbi:MAG: response regulator [Pseudobdellovibrionaceae bacterium]